MATEARPSSEFIEPTIYIEDYYGVLGLKPSATKAQIKESYKSLAFMNHPDRNNTPQALDIFRNATNAYRILTSDQKAIIDAKYRTKQSLDVLEEIGTGVLTPIAVGIALPLLNLTFRSISSVTKPIFRDAVEQSNVVIQTAFDKNGSPYDIVTRTAHAWELKRTEQSIARMRDSVNYNDVGIEVAEKELVSCAEKEKVLLGELSRAEKLLAQESRILDNLISDEKISLQNMKIANESTQRIQTNYNTEMNAIEQLTVRKNEIVEDISEVDLEIKRLEEQLKIMREEKIRLSREGISVSTEISAKKAKTTVFRDILSIETENLKAKKSILDNVEEKRVKTEENLKAFVKNENELNNSLDEKRKLGNKLRGRIQHYKTKNMKLEERIKVENVKLFEIQSKIKKAMMDKIELAQISNVEKEVLRTLTIKNENPILNSSEQFDQ